MRRLFALFVAALACVTAYAAPLQPGKDYVIIDPPLATTPGKVDVVEFFSYGCPHCKEFNPLISLWEQKLPPDVNFHKIPVSFGRPAWTRLATAYYAFETTGTLKKLDDAMFVAVHEERNPFATIESIADFAAGKGVERQKILDALQSFGMPSLLRQGEDQARIGKISAVPSVVVGGKYLIINPSSYDDLLRRASELIAKVRQESATKK